MRQRGENSRIDALWAAAIAVALHAAPVAVALAIGIEGTSEWHDQVSYHFPVIERFAAELPHPDLRDYQSATTPGYHLMMAVLLRAGAPMMGLHLVNALFGCLLVGLAAWMVTRFSSRRVGIAAGAVLAFSPYALSSSIALTTDNLGTLLVMAAFFLQLRISTGEWQGMSARVVLGGVAAALAAFVRQVFAYTAALPCVAVVARWCAARELPPRRYMVLSLLSLLPALALVAYFAWLWGGLVPPAFRGAHGSGANPVTPVYALAVACVWGVPAFLGIPGFLRALCCRRSLVLGAVAVAACSAVPSSYLQDVRWGGVLWTASRFFPNVLDRSLLIVGLAAAAAVSFGAVLRMWARSDDMARRGAVVYALFLCVGAIVAQTANQQCFERYLQPIMALSCVLAAAAVAGPSLRTWPMWVVAAVALACSFYNVFLIGA